MKHINGLILLAPWRASQPLGCTISKCENYLLSYIYHNTVRFIWLLVDDIIQLNLNNYFVRVLSILHTLSEKSIDKDNDTLVMRT